MLKSDLKKESDGRVKVGKGEQRTLEQTNVNLGKVRLEGKERSKLEKTPLKVPTRLHLLT